MRPTFRAVPLFALTLAMCVTAGSVRAADHGEAPLTRADAAADIADVYAWHDAASNKLVTILTFDGVKSPAHRQVGTFDDGVRYTVNIDNTGDFIADIEIYTTFALDSDGNWNVRVENLPGAGGNVMGRVEKKIKAGNTNVYAGLRDDPFFFDLEGFIQTLQTGALSFNGNRDSFAGTNCTAIALEMDLAAAQNGGGTLNIWATTAR